MSHQFTFLRVYNLHNLKITQTLEDQSVGLNFNQYYFKNDVKYNTFQRTFLKYNQILICSYS